MAGSIQSAPGGPSNRASHLTLESGIAPGIRKVAEGVVIGASGAVRLGPRQRVVPCRADRRRIESKQNLHARPRVLAERIELLGQRKPIAQADRRGVRLI